jgi:hypothetical protein
MVQVEAYSGVSISGKAGSGKSPRWPDLKSDLSPGTSDPNLGIPGKGSKHDTSPKNCVWLYKNAVR